MWVFLTLGAIVLWSLVNIADSYLVERNKKIGHPIGSLVIFSSLFGFIAALLIYTFVDTSLALSFKNILLLLLAGVCNLTWIVFYFNALTDEDVSSVIPWFLTVPFFAYLFGYFFLGETLTTQQIFGGLVIIAGGLVLSVKSSVGDGEKRSYHIKWKPIIYMTIASLLVSIWGMLFKYVAKDNDFWVSSFWEHIGLAIAGVLVLIFVASYREGFMTMLKKSGSRILSINLFSEVATISGNLLANYALLLVPITLVYLLQVAQPVVVFILGIICTVFFPSIIKEDISKISLLHKAISIIIMCVGALLII